MKTIKPCKSCGHINCICRVRAAHKSSCKYRIAKTASVGIECGHGYDVCPICDPCDCIANKESEAGR